jgi:hypothetical protein
MSYLRNYVQAPGVLAASTAAEYEDHIRNHILPAFGDLPMGQITPERIEQWLAQKAAQGLSWSTRCDPRNILPASLPRPWTGATTLIATQWNA